MLDNHYEDDLLEEQNATVNASQIHLKSRLHFKSIHEHTNHAKLKTVINTSDDDQIDSSIIFDDPYVENNEAKNQCSLNNELKKQKALLQKELETCKGRVKTLEKQPLKSLNYKEAYEELEREISVDKDKIDYLNKEKDKIQDEFFQLKNATDKLGSHDRVVFKMGQSIQTIHMLKKKPNKVYDPFLKAGTKLIIDSPESEEILEDAKESRLKMKDKMIQLNYEKLNALYETFVPQKEMPIEQTYSSTPSTSNVSSESSKEMRDLPVKNMPNESKLLKLFVKLDKSIGDLQTKIDQALLKDRSRALIFDDQDVLRLFYKTGSMEKKVENQSRKDKNFQDEIDRLLETSLSREIRDVASSSNVSRSESKDTNSKKRVLLNTKSKSTSKDVKKSQNTKTVDAVHDGSNLVCVSCGKDVFMISHDKCVARYALSLNSRVKGALFTSHVVAKYNKLGDTPVVAKSRFSVATPPKTTKKVIQIVLWIVDSGCSKHVTGNLKLLRNFVEKFMDTVHFGNENFAVITGYGDYVQGNLTICHVYNAEGPIHNRFSVGQFCDGDLEVAFHSNTCFIRNLEGEDLFTSFHETNLYTISISEMAASSPVCLMSKSTSTKSWLWHRRFSHFNSEI
ncbi:hypothetical protein Tco_0575096 [Tanacetum coccineum]